SPHCEHARRVQCRCHPPRRHIQRCARCREEEDEGREADQEVAQQDVNGAPGRWGCGPVAPTVCDPRRDMPPTRRVPRLRQVAHPDVGAAGRALEKVLGLAPRRGADTLADDLAAPESTLAFRYGRLSPRPTAAPCGLLTLTGIF